MTEREDEEMSPSLESSRTGPDVLRYYRDQVDELLSQEGRIPHHKQRAANKSSTETIGAELLDLKTEKLNALLRQCVLDSSPEIDEIQSRVRSMDLMYQLCNKNPSISSTNSDSVISEDPTFKNVEDDIQLLMKSDPVLVKQILDKHSSDLHARLDDKQQQLEKLLDNVVSTCRLINRPMSRGEKRDLQKSIKELPGPNLERVASFIKKHYAAVGKEMSDEVFVNIEKEDNVLLWRLHYYVAAVKSARELAS